MRAFTKEVSAWISECKAWNAECKLVRANNAQVGAGVGNCAQRVVKIKTMGRDKPLRISQMTGTHGRAIRIRNKTNMIMHPSRIGHKPNTANNVMARPPMCYKCRGWGHISHNCSSTQNYTEQGQVRDNLNYQWGEQNQALPREQPHAQSPGTTSKPVKFKGFLNTTTQTQSHS